MKLLALCLALISLPVSAQDPKSYLQSFDSKVYSLKTQGVQDFVVDLESSRLTKQMNEQMVFGNIKELIFRVYWTASPQRIAVEIQGLPEGFKEIKEELKVSVLSVLDDLLPIPLTEKFSNHKLAQGPGMKEITAKDQSGIAPIPAYTLKFDEQDRFAELIGQKPVGSFKVTNQYEKTSFSNGRWVLLGQVTENSESGQSMTARKTLSYGTHEGIGVLKKVTISMEQKFGKSAPLKTEETVEFKNYKLNAGEAMKYFLAEPKK